VAPLWLSLSETQDGSPTRRRCNGKEVKAAICPEMKVQCCTCLLPVVRDGLSALNLPPTRHLTDAATVMRFREVIRSQAIRSALERSSDTVLVFALRAVE
jgi:hypothetical protein